MIITIRENTVQVDRENGDPKYYGVGNAAGESRLLYAIKNQLNKEGYDLIKKRMWKDGHLVSEMQQYLRSRKPSGDPKKDIMMWNPMWAIEGIEEKFNSGSVVLIMNNDIFNKG